MAGGKETPRQKMIGMMYLVLLALLALQVSNTVLEKFIFINRSLETTVEETNVGNANTVGRIQTQVSDAGNRAADVKVLQSAQTVRERTREVLGNLNDLKEKLVEITGGYDPENPEVPQNVADEETMANFMINQKKGEELQKVLNEYAAFLEQTSGIETAPIALDAKDNPVFANDPNQKNKNFAELNFANTPLVAGLATITQFETEVLLREAAALDKLARDVGAQDIKFDVIVPMVTPEAKVVAAGTKYKADLFVAASSSGVDPDMYVNGNEIDVVGGMGKVEFVATAGDYNEEGLARKTYESKITVSAPGGNDTTFTAVQEYFVARPVIQIQSAAVQALYLQCGNELNVQVPALGTNYNPDFSATGAAVYEGNKRGLVTVVPNAADVVLTVKNDGTVLGAEKFGVRRVPKPELVPYSGNQPLDLKTGVPATRIRDLTMRAIADESFAEFLPKDANFRVAEYTVYLARGNRPVDEVKANGPEVDLRRFAAKAKPGDRIVIEVKKVQRLNFRKEIIDVPMGTPIFTVQLN